MKKFLSIFIALLLIVSLFATTAIAFAEETQEPSQSETTTPTEGEATEPTPGEGEEGEEEPAEPREKVTIVKEKLDEYLAEQCAWFDDYKIEMGDIKFGVEMLKDSTKVAEAFPGIKYVVSGDENYDDKKADNDKIYVEYCRPSESPKGQATWQNSVNITENIRISSSGWYLFRFVVKDKNNEIVSENNPEAYYSFYAEDTSRPVVSLSSTMKNKEESGLVAGTKYSVPTSGLTSGSTDEMSSTTVKYKIYKIVKGEETLIYDSDTKEVTKGYEAYVDTDGSITPSEDDISSETVYIVEYSVTDAYGFTGVANKADINNYSVAEYHPRMSLKVVAAPPIEDEKSVNVWEIVLFCIAGLAAIGIVVLLFIKPKEAAPARATSASKEEKLAATDESQE